MPIWNINNYEDLNKGNWNNKNMLIKFHMEGCGHCEMLKNVWKQIENKLKNTSLLIVNIDSSLLEFVPYSHDIIGFPTIRLVKNGKIIDYNEERTMSKIMHWLKKNKVTTKTLKKKIKRRKTLKIKK